MTPEIKDDKRNKEVVEIDLLLLYGGSIKKYDKNEYFFKEGQSAHFYYQLVEGKIRMVNETEDGKEFIQGFFSAGESFGEPPIFINDTYPASAFTA